MPYVVPTTFTAGSVLTAAQLNVIGNDLVDHELYVSPLRSAWTTYTPTITAGAGAYTTITITDARYMKTGKTVVLSFRIGITTKNTASGAMRISYPAGVTLANDGYQIGSGREINTTGKALTITARTSYMEVNVYDNTSPWADGTVNVGTITFEAA